MAHLQTLLEQAGALARDRLAGDPAPADPAPGATTEAAEVRLASSLAELLVQSMTRAHQPAPPPARLAAMTVHGLRALRAPPGEDPEVDLRPLAAEEDGEAGLVLVQVVRPDQRFLYDTLLLALEEAGLAPRVAAGCALVVDRGPQGRPRRLRADRSGDVSEEALLQAIVPDPGPEGRAALATDLTARLRRVHAMNVDFPAMRGELLQARDALRSSSLNAGAGPGAGGQAEAARLIDWLLVENFVLMGLTRAEIEPGAPTRPGDGPVLRLGIARLEPDEPAPAPLAETLALLDHRDPLLRVDAPVRVHKTAQRARVHRHGTLDEVVIGVRDPGGASFAIVAHGLFTLRAVRRPGAEIPVLRAKLDGILQAQGLSEGSIGYRATIAAFNALPMEFLIQADGQGIAGSLSALLGASTTDRLGAHLQLGPQRISLYGFVTMPLEQYSDDLRASLERLLRTHTRAAYVDHVPDLDRFPFAVLHFFLSGIAPGTADTLPALREAILKAARSWTDRLREALEQAADATADTSTEPLFARFEAAFPRTYREVNPVERGARDVLLLEQVRARRRLDADVLEPPGAPSGDRVHLRLYLERDLTLSEVLPTLDAFGLHVVTEDTEEIRPRGLPPMYIDTYALRIGASEPSPAAADRREAFLDAVRACLEGRVAREPLLRLTLLAGLPWRAVALLRAAVRYLRLAGALGSETAAREILLDQPALAAALVALFEARFRPGMPAAAPERAAGVAKAHEGVAALRAALPTFEQDRVFGALHGLLGQGIVRTSYFLPAQEPTRAEHPLLSFKVDHGRWDGTPPPRPRFEIFVDHPRVEGVHMRGGPVARGGLRFSDRLDDYRTEVLGLMLTQRVKNAIIVPTGAKGGFILRPARPDTPAPIGPEIGPGAPGDERAGPEWAYDAFITGLLDLTDDTGPSGVIRPPAVVAWDDDDPYLVVAADKGTARYSDRANAMAQARGFWIGDAFASGGSIGYDHKALGITAKGAWESVRRHFLELGLDPERDPITVAGIGDMSGDVFGNGLLLSRSVRLLAAFNHEHVFVDPDPDPEPSFAERARLFALPRSKWSDYRTELLSEGGGVYRRDARVIELHPRARARLGVDAERLSGAELVRAVLRAPVDLLWNGGIGTYVKSSAERHADVKDKSNDDVRVDATELRARVVAEGGNLGLTQAARVEAALRGVRLNTDAVDNSGGVDCSDHEVNLKLLLGGAVAEGALTRPERDATLRSLAEDVTRLVLADNRGQALMLSLDEQRALRGPVPFVRAQARFAEAGLLDVALQRLPDPDTVQARRRAGLAPYTRPELAVLCAHAKMYVQRELAEAGGPCAHAKEAVAAYFPESLRAHFGARFERHPLFAEIAATVLSQGLVDLGGASAVVAIELETGADMARIVDAWWLLDAVLDGAALRARLARQEAVGLDDEGRGRLRAERLALADALRESTIALLQQARPAELDMAFADRPAAMAALREDRETLAAAAHGEPPAAASLLPLSVALSLGRRRAGLTPGKVAAAAAEVGEATGLLAAWRLLSDAARDDAWEDRALRALKGGLLQAVARLTLAVAARPEDPPDTARPPAFADDPEVRPLRAEALALCADPGSLGRWVVLEDRVRRLIQSRGA